MNYTLQELSQLVQGEIVGDFNTMVNGLSPIDDIKSGSIIYAEGKDNLKLAEDSQAAAVLVSQTVQNLNKPHIKVSEPLKAFILLLQHFYPEPVSKPTVHPTAIIGENVQLGEGVSVGAYVVIGDEAVLGDRSVIKAHVTLGNKVQVGSDCVLHPHVTVYDHCILGNKVIVHASSVIGSDGFGYHFVDGKQMKIPHAGIVKIGDEVEIGANTVVDRATLGATSIGSGTKIDNLVQVAHSVKLGKNNILCAFTGIAGSSTSGDNVIFAANVGVSDHVTIDDEVILGARAGVPPKKHLLKGNIYLGSPARPRDKAIEQEMSVSRIPIMNKNLKALTEKVKKIQESLALTEADRG